MICIVLDTNVLLSAILWGGKPGSILSAAKVGQLQLAISRKLTSELLDVLSRPKARSKVQETGLSPEELVAGITSISIQYEPSPLSGVVLADPDDDAVVACAVAAEADYIISGDRHLLSLGSYQGIQIYTVDHFLNTVMPKLLE